MIEYRIGDATAPPERSAIIAHICNDAGRWGAGFVLALSRRWSEPERYYRECHRAGVRLGDTQTVIVEPGLTVCNMIAQHGIGRRNGPPIRYDALETCLRTVAGLARHQDATVHMPRIGCGLAGGTWAEVGPIVERTMDGISAYVYDLEGRA